MASMDEAKGRAKEGAGKLTGDKGLSREGKADRTSGKVKDTVDKLAGKAKNVVGRGKKK